VEMKIKPWDFEAAGLGHLVAKGTIEQNDVKDALKKLKEKHNAIRVDDVISILQLDKQPARLQDFQEAYVDVFRAVCINNCVMSIVVILFIIHPNVSQYTIDVFTCRQLEEGRLFLAKDLDTECWTPEHTSWAFLVGLPGLICYTFGIPLIGYLALHGVRHQLSNLHVQLKYGFLYFGYRPKYYYWEIWVMVRKILLVFITVFVKAVGPLTEATSSMILVCFTLILHLHVMPYDTDDLNSLESVSLYASLITLLCGIYFYSNELDEGSVEFFVGLIITINILFCLYFVYISWDEVVAEFFDYAQKVPIIKKYVPKKYLDNEDGAGDEEVNVLVSAQEVEQAQSRGNGNVKSI